MLPDQPDDWLDVYLLKMGSDNFSGLGIIPANPYVVKIYIFPNFLNEVPSTYQNLKMKNSNTKEHIFLPFYVVSRRTKIPGIVEMF